MRKKVNFGRCFVDYDGSPLSGEKGKPEMVRDVVATLLFNGGQLHYGTGDDGGKKIRAYALSKRVMAGEAEIGLEDRELILEAVSGLTAGCYAQVAELLEMDEDK